MTRPNILLIVFDTARADAFEPYGAPHGASPTVADLASAGAASPATFSTACWTMPSHMSLFTGRLPRDAGFHPVHGMANYRPQVEALRPWMLPSVLSEAGYETFGLSTNLWISPATRFDRAFDEFAFIRGWRTKKLAATSWRTRIGWYREALRARVDDGAAEAGGRLEEWLTTRRSREPFFCFVNMIECHSPYLPPKPYNQLSTPDRLRAASEARRHLTLSSIWKCSTGAFDLPDDAVARMRNLYRASIRQLDDWLARVLEVLDRRGLLAETQVVVTSDHGENLGEGRMLGHAFSLDDRLLRIPLVTSGPVGLPPEGLLSLRAVPGWLAEIGGVTDHPFASADEVDGVAVAQFDALLNRSDPRVGEAVAEWGLDADLTEEVTRRLTTSFTCATDGSMKLIRRLGREELFDLAADPFEESPMVMSAEHERTYGPRLTPLRAALDRARSEPQPTPDASPDGHGPTPGPSDASDEETARIEDQMRLLGYL